jgi:magnesium-transporting ATPase (P-type)
MQVVNVHLCRSRRRSILSRPLFENRLIGAGIVAEVVLILAIDYTAPGNAMFGTAPIGLDAWLVVLPFATAMLVLEEVRKAVIRSREGAGIAVPDAANVSETATSRF